MRTEYLCISVLRVASGPRVKLASCKSAGGLLYWPFEGGGPGVSLTLCCFVVYSTRRFVLCLTLCHFVLVFFSPFCITITSLGEERADLSAFVRLFDFCLFGFVDFLFLLVSEKSCGLWLWHSLDFSLTFFFCFFDAICSKYCLVLVCPCVFSVLWALRLPRLEKRELILMLLVRFYSIENVLFYLFPPPLGVWEGLRFLIVALAGFLCFSVLWALQLPRLGKRELILVLLVRFFSIAIVWFYLFPFPLGVWEELWFLTVALAGLFSYPF